MSPQKGQRQSPEIAEALRVIFDECNASPGEVAATLGVSRMALHRWRDGTHEPSWGHGQRLLQLAADLRKK